MPDRSELNAWKEMPLKQKMKLLDYWTICIILGNLSHIFGLFFFISAHDLINVKSMDQLIGLGTFFIWLSLTKYLQYSKKLYTLPATMYRAGIVILVASVSVLPIMIGLSYFCMSIFGLSWRFRDLSSSLIMLWALLNGDEV